MWEWPNQDQWLSILRTFLKILGSILVARGTMGITSSMWEQISGAIIILFPIVWDLYVHSATGKLKAVEAMPDVQKILVKSDSMKAVEEAVADPTRTKVTTQ